MLSLMSDTLHFLSPVLCLEARCLKLLLVPVTSIMTQSNVERKGFIFAHLYRNSWLDSLVGGGGRHKGILLTWLTLLAIQFAFLYMICPG